MYVQVLHRVLVQIEVQNGSFELLNRRQYNNSLQEHNSVSELMFIEIDSMSAWR